MYLIKKGSKFVARPGSKHSYTINPINAQKFNSYEDAKRNACWNESVVRCPVCMGC